MSSNETPVTIIDSRKTTSGIAKRLRDALSRRHKLSISSAQSTELTALALGHPSANHMAAALNSISVPPSPMTGAHAASAELLDALQYTVDVIREGAGGRDDQLSDDERQAIAQAQAVIGNHRAAAPDPDGYAPYTVILLDNYRDEVSIEHVEARSVDEAMSLATAQYQVNVAEKNGFPTSEEVEIHFLSGVGYAAVFPGHLNCLFRAQEDGPFAEGDENASAVASVRVKQAEDAILDKLHEIAIHLSNFENPANRKYKEAAEAMVEKRISALQSGAGVECIGAIIDLLQIYEMLTSHMKIEIDSDGDDLNNYLAPHVWDLIIMLEKHAGEVPLGEGPVYGADPEIKLYQMTGAYGDDGGYWGAHVPAASRDDAVQITREIMTTNSGVDLDEDDAEVDEFEIIDDFEVSPREVATKDLIRDPDFNAWSPAMRAARIEIRAREYLQGAGL